MRINEIFYSLQGEGRHTGTPAVFVRFAGCNLKCSFCDTDHSRYVEMTEEEIVEEVRQFPARFVVITGGEPSMQVTASLIEKFHEEGCYVAMETNGTYELPEDCKIDWITCSPKGKPLKLHRIDELKVVYEGNDEEVDRYANADAKEYRLQPCDVKDETQNRANLQGAIEYCLKHPKWKLSLQTHKIINVR